MSVQKAIKQFTNRWVVNMKKLAPVAKVRGGALKKSIEPIPNPTQPVVTMLYYGQFQNSGTKYIKNPSRFIDKSFVQTTKEMGDDLMVTIFNDLKQTFDKQVK